MNTDSVSIFWDELKAFILSQYKEGSAGAHLINTLDRIYKPKLLKAIDERNSKV